MNSINRIRIDKWLWHCRLFKSRTLAARHIKSGYYRLNGNRVNRSSVLLKPGDVIIFMLNNKIKILKMLAAGKTRGCTLEAMALYEDLTAVEKPREI